MIRTKLIRLAYSILFRNRNEEAGRQAIGDLFHVLYSDLAVKEKGTWRETFWLGTPALKCPLDLWIYQEIIQEVRPDIIVETGTHMGGAALFMAHVCDLRNHGRVVSVDITPQAGRPNHPRIEYLTGSSVAPEIVESVRARTKPGDKVLVILDSDHRMPHVLEEMRIYSTLVTKDSYMIVEDTNINGHPVVPDFGPGPMEAVMEFLAVNRDFVAQKKWEKFVLTFNPHGYLKRVT